MKCYTTCKRPTAVSDYLKAVGGAVLRYIPPSDVFVMVLLGVLDLVPVGGNSISGGVVIDSDAVRCSLQT